MNGTGSLVVASTSFVVLLISSVVTPVVFALTTYRCLLVIVQNSGSSASGARPTTQAEGRVRVDFLEVDMLTSPSLLTWSTTSGWSLPMTYHWPVERTTVGSTTVGSTTAGLI